MKLGGDSNIEWNLEWSGIFYFDDCCSTAAGGELRLNGEGEISDGLFDSV